jgi:hypothetical protein
MADSLSKNIQERYFDKYFIDKRLERLVKKNNFVPQFE